MRQLILMRHAKTEVHNSAGDHARNLTKRGLRDCVLITQELVRRNLVPDIALVSDATRTSQTAAAMKKQLQDEPHGTLKIQLEAGLYLAAPDSIMQKIWTVPDPVQKLIIIGHNPGLHELAYELAGHGSDTLKQQLASNFPTSAVAVLTFAKTTPDDSWADITSGAGTLDHFFTAKQLRAQDVLHEDPAGYAGTSSGQK